MLVCGGTSSSESSCNGETGTDSVGSVYTEIVLVRHGETAWNATGFIQGQLDIELNDKGRQQAALVADRLSREPEISAIYSSDLKRAYETAQIIATRCGGLEVREDQGLRERHVGDLQGLVFHELDNLNSKASQAFKSNRTDQEIPGGGESCDQLYKRCTSSVQRICTEHKGERVVVVTHGGVICSMSKRDHPEFSCANASLTILHLYNEGEWIIKTWSDVRHLEQGDI